MSDIHRMEEAALDPQLQELVTRVVKEDLSDSTDVLVARLKRDAPAMLAEHRALRAGFEARLRERWGSALDLFEICLVIAEEAGETFNQEHWQCAETERDYMLWVLVRLYARACHTATEVLSLLNSGHATAAMAHWRTIHEIAAVMFVIREHGQETAKRYLAHEVIESAKAAEDYQKYHVQLGYEPLPDAELDAVRKRRADLIAIYGRDFKSQYGWASEALGIRQPNLEHLREAAKLGHMQPHYRMASHGMHSNPKGILFKLEQIGREQVLLTGASNAGLADPGHGTLISLLQCTVALLNTDPDEKVVITLMALSRLVDEAGNAFLAIHQALAREEEALQAKHSQPNEESNGEELNGDTGAAR